jgi:predicted DNA-binding transcriptional regulator AlpA
MKPPRQPEDPILSPQEMAADGGMSEATWYRNYRYHPDLKIIWISPRRIGARFSNWRRVLEAQTEGEAA